MSQSFQRKTQLKASQVSHSHSSHYTGYSQVFWNKPSISPHPKKMCSSSQVYNWGQEPAQESSLPRTEKFTMYQHGVKWCNMEAWRKCKEMWIADYIMVDMWIGGHGQEQKPVAIFVMTSKQKIWWTCE
jgi:hypothetical protein